LVLCSEDKVNIRGDPKNFPLQREEVERTLLKYYDAKKIHFEFLNGYKDERFPENVGKNEYNVFWFCGCILFSHIFNNFSITKEKLTTNLKSFNKKESIVFFTESVKFETDKRTTKPKLIGDKYGYTELNQYLRSIDTFESFKPFWDWFTENFKMIEGPNERVEYPYIYYERSDKLTDCVINNTSISLPEYWNPAYGAVPNDEKGPFNLQRVSGDNSCLFHSLYYFVQNESIQCNLLNTNSSHYEILTYNPLEPQIKYNVSTIMSFRNAIVDYIEDRPLLTIYPSIEEPIDTFASIEERNEWISEMRERNTWGDVNIIQAFVCITGRTVNVYDDKIAREKNTFVLVGKNNDEELSKLLSIDEILDGDSDGDSDSDSDSDVEDDDGDEDGGEDDDDEDDDGGEESGEDSITDEYVLGLMEDLDKKTEDASPKKSFELYIDFSKKVKPRIEELNPVVLDILYSFIEAYNDIEFMEWIQTIKMLKDDDIPISKSFRDLDLISNKL